MKEDKTLSNGTKVFVTECPNCKTEYRYENIEELKLIKGYFNKVYSELGTGIEVWVKFVKCQCGKLFVPTVKKIVYEEPKQVEIKEEEIIKKEEKNE